MARFLSANEAASLVVDNSFTDSEDESEIEEDPSFPLPHADDDGVLDSAGGEQPHLSVAIPAQQPLPSSAHALSSALESRSPTPTPTPDVRDVCNSGKQKYRARNSTCNYYLTKK